MKYPTLTNLINGKPASANGRMLDVTNPQTGAKIELPGKLDQRLGKERQDDSKTTGSHSTPNGGLFGTHRRLGE